ncbi:MAG: DUF2452 domain-containing protein [Flavobacteriales bacterium]
MSNKKKQEDSKDKEKKENPIDEENVTDKPDTLKYAHHRGSAQITPVDKSKVKGRAMSAMQEQTDQQLGQIKKQMEVLAEQAQEIQNRIQISEKVYEAETNFEPLIGHTYHLYQRKKGTFVLSMIGPNDWGKRSMPYKDHVATVKLLSDHTWEVVEKNENFENDNNEEDE